MIVLTLESWLPGTTRAVLSPYARQRQTVITGTIKTQVDQIWNAFWSGGISNPMEVIEQMTYLLFIKRLDELQTVKEKKANRTKAPVEDPIFNSRQQKLRWSKFKSLGDPAAMYARVADEVFPFIKSLGGRKGASPYAAHMKDARFTIPSAALLRSEERRVGKGCVGTCRSLWSPFH